MADPRVRRRALWLAPESTYATDPGSNYLAVPAMELGEIQDGRAVLETNRFTGRDGSTPTIAGPDSQEYQFMLEAIGFDSSVDDGSSPPSADYFDQLTRGCLGDVAERDGEGVTSLSGTTLTLDTDVGYAEGDLVALRDADGSTRWVTVTSVSGGGVYEVTPDISADFTPTVAVGSRQHRWDNGTDQTPTFTSVIDQDSTATGGQQYTLVGSKITGLTWAITPSEQAKATFQIFADGQAATSKTGLPANSGETPSTPLRSACVYVNGTELEVAQIDIDFGLTAQPREATCRDNGRSQHLLIGCEPTVTITPVFTNDLLDLKRTQAQRTIMIQLGTGLRSVAWYAPVAQVAEAPRQGDGIQRLGLQFAVRDAGLRSDGTVKPRWIQGRC